MQRLQELRMNLFYDIAADNAFHILNLYEKIVFENLRGYKKKEIKSIGLAIENKFEKKYSMKKVIEKKRKKIII